MTVTFHALFAMKRYGVKGKTSAPLYLSLGSLYTVVRYPLGEYEWISGRKNGGIKVLFFCNIYYNKNNFSIVRSTGPGGGVGGLPPMSPMLPYLLFLPFCPVSQVRIRVRGVFLQNNNFATMKYGSMGRK